MQLGMLFDQLFCEILQCKILLASMGAAVNVWADTSLLRPRKMIQEIDSLLQLNHPTRADADSHLPGAQT